MAQRPDGVVAIGADVDDCATRVTLEARVGPTELAADRAAQAARAIPRQERKVGGARFGTEGARRCAHLTSVDHPRDRRP